MRNWVSAARRATLASMLLSCPVFAVACKYKFAEDAYARMPRVEIEFSNTTPPTGKVHVPPGTVGEVTTSNAPGSPVAFDAGGNAVVPVDGTTTNIWITISGTAGMVEQGKRIDRRDL